jgi:hypothetical protein
MLDKQSKSGKRLQASKEAALPSPIAIHTEQFCFRNKRFINVTIRAGGVNKGVNLFV